MQDWIKVNQRPREGTLVTEKHLLFTEKKYIFVIWMLGWAWWGFRPRGLHFKIFCWYRWIGGGRGWGCLLVHHHHHYYEDAVTHHYPKCPFDHQAVVNYGRELFINSQIFNGCTIAVWKWINNFRQNFMMYISINQNKMESWLRLYDIKIQKI